MIINAKEYEEIEKLIQDAKLFYNRLDMVVFLENVLAQNKKRVEREDRSFKEDNEYLESLITKEDLGSPISDGKCCGSKCPYSKYTSRWNGTHAISQTKVCSKYGEKVVECITKNFPRCDGCLKEFPDRQCSSCGYEPCLCDQQ